MSIFRKREDPELFRQRVAELLRRAYPRYQIDMPQGEPDFIILEGMQLGLQNLRSNFDLSDKSQQSLEQLVDGYLAVVTSTMSQGKPAEVRSFDEVKDLLRPQIMRPNLTAQVPVIQFGFGQTLSVGVVIEDEKFYSYVNEEHSTLWGKNPGELLGVAIKNLNEASSGIQMRLKRPIFSRSKRWIHLTRPGS